MKSLMLGGLLLAMAFNAIGASRVDLAVHGAITPSACTPSLSAGGVIDYGKIAAKDLAADSSTWLPDVTLKLQVNCTAPVLFALRGTDNRTGTAHKDDGYGYGMGLINGDEKVGTYLMTLRSPVSDTAQVIPLISTNNGEFWWGFPQGAWLTWHTLTAFGNSDSGVPAPLALASVTAELLIEASIAPASGLTLDREVPLDGSATIEVLYL